MIDKIKNKNTLLEFKASEKNISTYSLKCY